MCGPDITQLELSDIAFLCIALAMYGEDLSRYSHWHEIRAAIPEDQLPSWLTDFPPGRWSSGHDGTHPHMGLAR